MVTINNEDGSVSILLGPDDPQFEILTWCSDTEGEVPEQVHFVIQPTSDVKILYRFTGPKTLTSLINALVEHREDVWPGYEEA